MPHKPIEPNREDTDFETNTLNTEAIPVKLI